MKKIHLHSLAQKMTVYYGSVFFFLIVLLTFFYYFTAYNTFLDNHIRTSDQLAKIISKQTDDLIDTANKLEVRMLESKEVLKYVFELAQTQTVKKDWDFRETLYAITGYNYEFYHMNIVNLNEGTIHTFGEEYTYKPYTVSPEIQKFIVEPTLSLDGRKRIFVPEEGCLYAPIKDVPVLCVSRSFGQYPLSQKTAIIEIQVKEDSIQKQISDILVTYENSGEEVLIFDSSKNPVYPSDISREELAYYTALDTQKNRKPSLFSLKDELVTSYYSAETGFTTMLITPTSYLVANRQFYLLVCLLLFLITFGLVTFITHRLAYQITAPITSLKDSISRLELVQIGEEDYEHTTGASFNELEILNESYNRMQERLKQSLDDVVNSRTLTIQSQMMALQAQMDSHFLYNTLTIISIIAEDNDDEQAAAMCIKLTQMLRYITEDISKDTTFAQEMTHTNNYTSLLSTRFGSMIEFRYDPNPALNTVRVPRLIIQPLVENCVKYSRKPDRPLVISIHSWIGENYWYLNVTDNGDGFSEEALSALEDRIATLDPEQQNPALTINGMGLMNIYLRLKLYYKNQFIFQLENKQTSDASLRGASITIGGILS